MKNRELLRQHAGNISTCKRLQAGRDYFRRWLSRTSIQIARDLDRVSARDLIRGLRENGFKFDRDCEGKNSNGAIVYRWTLTYWPGMK